MNYVLDIPSAAHCRPDPELDATVLSAWRQEGATLVKRHWGEFHGLVARIRPLIEKHRYGDAATAAQLAASYAVQWHTGAFRSGELERAINDLGVAALGRQNSGRTRHHGDSDMRILHVATHVGRVGGHVRMIWRWIKEDTRNVHSVALTRQFSAIPENLRSAVDESGGRIHLLNKAPGRYLGWARHLRSRMQAADLVILHSDSKDIIPFLAIAGMQDRPPLVLLQHTDHLFWLGTGVVDAVVSSRISGRNLCILRRGIEAERNLLLPLCLEGIERTRSRAEAKRALGIPAEDILLLSIARGTKYRTVGKKTYADLLVPTLETHPRTRLTVIGPGGIVDWAEVTGRFPGRIEVLPETPETKTHLEAADIYIDSFPFPSNTSLFEAGMHELPLITYYPFGPGCEVMGADSMGFDETILRAFTGAEFDSLLANLVADADMRARVGSRTSQSIQDTNFGASWKRAIREIYASVLALPERGPAIADGDGDGDEPEYSDLDLFSHFAFGNPIECASLAERLALISELEIKALPLVQRFRTWRKLRANGRFAYATDRNAFRYLVPEWLTRQIQFGLRAS